MTLQVMDSSDHMFIIGGVESKGAGSVRLVGVCLGEHHGCGKELF